MTTYSLATSLAGTLVAIKSRRDCLPNARAALALMLATGLTACASDLVVKEDNPRFGDCNEHRADDCDRYRTIAGIPIHPRVPAIEFFALNAHSENEDCRSLVRARRTMIVSGRAQYLNVDSDPFATASLTVKYASDGAVQEISFNSEPSGEAIEAATTALSTLLPFVGITSDAQANEIVAKAKDEEDAAPRPALPPLCDSGEVSLETVPEVEIDSFEILKKISSLQVKVDEIQTD